MENGELMRDKVDVIIRLLKYTIVGLAGTAAQYLVLVSLVEVGHFHSPVVASTVGAILGAVINYFLNYKFTFKSDSSHGATLPRFLFIAAVGMGVNAVLMKLLINVMGVKYIVAQIVATGCVFLSSFALNSIWTFNAKNG
ncbi:GtrA family protein [Burkholderia multivorans]|uniref:GtrA family protein n=1 Tax=Burkholderia multivorans TaxID=87883 RepID=UPI0011B271D8|nr:GtrA family protein [Burkholderia multivorans]MCO1371829.1 GtrA family protein [Burkholderia multivorans]MCO1456923.1 GtrA family protein [Burkholderia multivorans]MCO1465909.1 GtrA family protein [Burkholderia multivorans]UQO16384.1 GtrA family protein [Burkholderia multivorans]UQO86244.1 GtrA family protein [Burkholderia multivorans]